MRLSAVNEPALTVLIERRPEKFSSEFRDSITSWQEEGKKRDYFARERKKRKNEISKQGRLVGKTKDPRGVTVFFSTFYILVK